MFHFHESTILTSASPVLFNSLVSHPIIKVPMKQKFWVVVLLSHIKDHLIQRRMQVTTSRYLFSLQSYKGLNIQNQWDIEKGLGTRICDVIRLESQFCENLNYLLLI